MNKVELIGRLVRDPDIRFTGEDGSVKIARYTLAVERKGRKDKEDNADFISCIAFGKGAEFAQNHLLKGMRIGVSGHIQTGSFTNKDGVKVYTTSVVVEEHYFADGKANANSPAGPMVDENGFMTIDAYEDEIPFK